MRDQQQWQKKNNPGALKEEDINKWIEKGVTADLVKQADASAELMAKKGLTKNQFRNVFEEVRRIETLISENDEKSIEALRALLMLQPKLAYLEKRDSATEGVGFKELRKLLRPAIDKLAEDFSKKTFNHFIDLVEALLGFHFHHAGRKDKS